MIADISSRERGLSLAVCCYSKSLKIPLSRVVRVTSVFASVLTLLALGQLGVSRSRAGCLVPSTDGSGKNAVPRAKQVGAWCARSRNDLRLRFSAEADEIVEEGSRLQERIAEFT